MFPRYQTINLPRLSKGVGPNFRFRRYHSAIAKFTTIDSKGTSVSCDTGIMVGEPGESYVYIEPEVGKAIKSAVTHQLGSVVAGHPKTLPLQFYHGSNHFAHGEYCLDFDRLYAS